MGSLYAVLKVLEGEFLNPELKGGDFEEVEEVEIFKEIVRIRENLRERVPEIKIASNLFK